MFPQIPYGFQTNVRLYRASSTVQVGALSVASFIGEVRNALSSMGLRDVNSYTDLQLVRYADSLVGLGGIATQTYLSSVKQASSLVEINPIITKTLLSRLSQATSIIDLANVSTTATGSLVPSGQLYWRGVTQDEWRGIIQDQWRSIEQSETQIWTPSNITTQLWLDASDSATITLVSGAVSQWADKSGNGRNATQSNATKRPTLLSTNINGLDVLSFDNSDDAMTTGWNLSATNNYMIFMVVNQVGSGDKRVINSTTYNNQISNSRQGGQYVQIKEDVIVGTNWSVSGTTNQSVLVAPSLGNFSYFGNGTSISTNAKSVTDWGVLTLGALGVYNEPMNGKLCEVIVTYSSDTTTRQLVEGYLAHKWGLTANLPSDHPYKITPPTL